MTYISTANSYLVVDGERIAYRQIGEGKSPLPLLMLTHLAATLDEWDPKLIDLLAKDHHVLLLDLPGVGASQGQVASTIPLMARQAITIVQALGYTRVNLLGLSMGGMIAQEIVRAQPELVNRLILAGTGPRGGQGLDAVTRKTLSFMLKGLLNRQDPKRYIFYNHDRQGGVQAAASLDRMKQRASEQADSGMRLGQFYRQLRAIKRWSRDPEDSLAHILQPTLVVNGDNDLQVPTENTRLMHAKIADSEMVIYPRSGHGSIFQNADDFAERVRTFLG